MPAVVAGAVGVLAVGTAVVVRDDDSSGTPKKQVAQVAPLKLTAPGAAGAPGRPGQPGGISMNSCIMFSVDILKDMQTAFAGTATEVSPGKVVLDVDHWYKPADSDVTTVELSTPDGVAIAVDSVEFVKGTRYLVTATDGNVNTCGYTGEATPDLEASFQQAFGS
jgi:hypothetical protein